LTIEKTRVRFSTSKGDGNMNAGIQGMGDRNGSHPAPGLFEVLRQELKLRNYSYKTFKAYRSHLRAFAKYISPRHPRDVTEQDVRAYLLHLIQDKNLTAGTIGDNVKLIV
jgi:hypothetical protein